MPRYLVPVFLKGQLMVEADSKLEAITTTYHLKNSKINVTGEIGSGDLPFVVPSHVEEVSIGMWPSLVLDGISKTGTIKEVK